MSRAVQRGAQVVFYVFYVFYTSNEKLLLTLIIPMGSYNIDHLQFSKLLHLASWILAFTGARGINTPPKKCTSKVLVG